MIFGKMAVSCHILYVELLLPVLQDKVDRLVDNPVCGHGGPPVCLLDQGFFIGNQESRNYESLH